MAEIKTKPTTASVEDFLNTVKDEQKRKDSFVILELMKKASGEEPKMWGSSIIGFGKVRLKSPATGREVDWLRIGFSPRKAKSKWSLVNVKRYKQLVKEGRVHPAGKAAYEARNAGADLYAFERKTALQLDPAFEKQFRANKRAWKVVENQPPGYRKLMIFRVMSAKREETRARRFAGLLEQSAKERRMDLLG